MSKKTYLLSDRPQLIDLNGNHVNFIVDFQAIAKDPTQIFQMIVLTQEQLDTTDIDKVEMKKAIGQIGGSITANNNKYQNYFLIIKKSNDTSTNNEPVEVEVNINIRQPPNPPTTNEMSQQETSSKDISTSSSNTPDTSSTHVIPIYKKPWFWIFILLLGIFGSLYYYFYIYKNMTSATKSVEVPAVVNEENSTPIHTLSEETKLYNRVSNIGKN